MKSLDQRLIEQRDEALARAEAAERLAEAYRTKAVENYDTLAAVRELKDSDGWGDDAADDWWKAKLAEILDGEGEK